MRSKGSTQSNQPAPGADWLFCEEQGSLWPRHEIRLSEPGRLAAGAAIHAGAVLWIFAPEWEANWSNMLSLGYPTQLPW